MAIQANNNTAPAPVASGSAGLSLVDDPQPALLRDLLTRTLTLAVASLLQGAPELAAEAEALGRSIKDARTEASLNEVSGKLKQLCFKIELKSGDICLLYTSPSPRD